MSARRHGVTGFLLTLALSAAPAVRAQGPERELAREHFQAGVVALDANDIESALRSFRAAYELAHCPEVLVTIAAAEERRAAIPAAVEALSRYLALAPDGLLAETARARLEALESALSSAPSGEAPGASSNTPLNETPLLDARPSLTPVSAFSAPTQGTRAVRPLPSAALADAPQSQPRRSWIRLPAFIAFGVGGLGASGALATGLIASGRYNDPANCTTHCGEGHTVSSRTLLITSGVLASVAAASIGAGVVLLLTKPSHSPRNVLVPALRLKLSTEKAAAGAVWRF